MGDVISQPVTNDLQDLQDSHDSMAAPTLSTNPISTNSQTKQGRSHKKHSRSKMASATFGQNRGVDTDELPAHYKGVKYLVDGKHGSSTDIPDLYVRPKDNRQIVDSPDLQLPIIDVSDLETSRRPSVIKAIGEACKEWGFFMVKNYGIPKPVMEEEIRVGREFFHLGSEEKMQYFSTDPKSKMRYGTSFNVTQDKVLNWRDFLRYSCRPLQEMWNSWPAKPDDFRKVNAEYIEHVGVLARRLLEGISESLGLPKEYINESFGEDYSQYMAYNFYPACPSPDRTLGLTGHSDPGGLTLLMQDGVGGLQVLNRDRWVVVRPVPDTLIINLGDQLQLLTNDEYKSVEHRVVVNSTSERVSVATAYGPSFATTVAPAPHLLHSDRPALYRSCVYGKFMDDLESTSLHKKSVLATLRIDDR